MSEYSVKRYLVLCTGNRCRSQMAHGWLEHFGGGRVAVDSAGTQPKGVHPLSVQVMAEAGVDISGNTSDHVDQYAANAYDAVITVCDSANEACPTFPGAAMKLHHSFPDPDDKTGMKTEAELLPVFRDVRDQIKAWAEQFVREQSVA